MKAYSDSYLVETQRRGWQVGFLTGVAVCFLVGLVLLRLFSAPAAVSAPQDPRMDKLCHWPAKPGEGMVALVLEDGTKRCFELGR